MANESHPHRPLLPYLRSVVEDARSSTVRSSELRAALDALLAAARPDGRAALETIVDRFWRAAGELNSSVRMTWLRAALATIEEQIPSLERAA